MKRWLLVSGLVGLCGMLFAEMLLQNHLVRSYQPPSWEKHLTMRAEEYSVYSAVLDADFVSKRRIQTGLSGSPALFWVLNETNPRIGPEHTVKAFAQLGAPQDAVADFLAQNLTTYPLDSALTTRSPARLVNRAELSTVGELPYAMIEFSRVGFDRTMTHAAVFVILGCHASDCGSAHTVFLSKQNGRWGVNGSETIWIS